MSNSVIEKIKSNFSFLYSKLPSFEQTKATFNFLYSNLPSFEQTKATFNFLYSNLPSFEQTKAGFNSTYKDIPSFEQIKTGIINYFISKTNSDEEQNRVIDDSLTEANIINKIIANIKQIIPEAKESDIKEYIAKITNADNNIIKITTEETNFNVEDNTVTYRVDTDATITEIVPEENNFNIEDNSVSYHTDAGTTAVGVDQTCNHNDCATV